MPHLRLRGFYHDAEAPFPALLDTLAALAGCPADWFTVEVVATRFITPASPMVEVLWFPREQAVQDRIARAITEAYAKESPTIVFFALGKSDYYEDGKNFA